MNFSDPTGHVAKKVKIDAYLHGWFRTAYKTGKYIRINFISKFDITKNVLGLYLFYKLVKTDALFDLKNNDKYIEKYKGKNITFEGVDVRFDDPGNILFGFFSAACGLPVDLARFGAGVYQIKSGTSQWYYWLTSYGDDPRDSIMIQCGYAEYKKNWRKYS